MKLSQSEIWIPHLKKNPSFIIIKSLLAANWPLHSAFCFCRTKKERRKKENAVFGKLQLSFSRTGFEKFFAWKPHKASSTAASFILANLVITLYNFLKSIQTDAIPTGLQKITCRIALDDSCSHFQLSHFGTVFGHLLGGGGRWWKLSVYRLPLWLHSILLLMPAG